MEYLVFVAAYLLGSIPFGYIVARYWKGVNILEHGSGNIGFTNVLRTVGWKPAALVLVGDVGKGAVATWLGMKTGGENFGILCGAAALLGHSFSVFLRFRGGKLVATGLGVLIILAPATALVALVIWLSAVIITRYVSLASLLAAVGLIPSSFVFGYSPQLKIFLALAALFVIYRHRSNIKKLLQGQEYKIGQKAERK